MNFLTQKKKKVQHRSLYIAVLTSSFMISDDLRIGSIKFPVFWDVRMVCQIGIKVFTEMLLYITEPVLPKCWHPSTKLYGLTTQKTKTLIMTTMRTPYTIQKKLQCRKLKILCNHCTILYCMQTVPSTTVRILKLLPNKMRKKLFSRAK